MNAIEDYVTIHLQLIQMDKWEYSTLHDKFNRLCAPNKKEDLNLNVFNMITGINESKT